MNLQNKMAVKVTKKVKYATTLYQKINATTSTFYMENFIPFSKKTNLEYAALLLYAALGGLRKIFSKCDVSRERYCTIGVLSSIFHAYIGFLIKSMCQVV